MYSSLPKTISYLALLVLPILFSGCSFRTPDIFEKQDGGPDRHVDIDKIPNAVPKYEKRSRTVNPSSYEVLGKRYYVMPSAEGFTERGIASWYGNKFHGRNTASGERYDMFAMTAAHKTLPLPSYVEVTNLENGRKIIVKANDRGPFHQNRIIDLSYVAAAKLDIIAKGTGLVEIKVINPGYASSDNSPNQSMTTTNRPSISKTPGIFIQAGAFSDKSNALRMKTKLHNKLNQPVRITEFVTATNTLHRVQVGPLLNVDIADNISLKLADIGVFNLKLIID